VFERRAATNVVSMSHTDIEVTFVAGSGRNVTPTQPPLTFSGAAANA
jgi:hypothetical protein